MTNSIFPPDPQEPRKSNTGLYVLFGCVGCGCLAGVALFVLALITAWFVPAFDMHQVAEQLMVERTVPAGSYTVGSDFTLYGKTLDNEDFDWESLRGKYVLVKFTATWCPPCRLEIPGMLDAYEKYHDKGFEIVSVYIWEDDPNPVATVRRSVEQVKLSWIIVSEALTEQAGQQPHRDAFGIQTVPTMLLIDKEGKVVSTNARGLYLKHELLEVFGE